MIFPIGNFPLHSKSDIFQKIHLYLQIWQLNLMKVNRSTGNRSFDLFKAFGDSIIVISIDTDPNSIKNLYLVVRSWSLSIRMTMWCTTKIGTCLCPFRETGHFPSVRDQMWTCISAPAESATRPLGNRPAQYTCSVQCTLYTEHSEQWRENKGAIRY